MKRVTQFILLCALVLACVLPAMAATYYVDGTNGSENIPVRLLRKLAVYAKIA